VYLLAPVGGFPGGRKADLRVTKLSLSTIQQPEQFLIDSCSFLIPIDKQLAGYLLLELPFAVWLSIHSGLQPYRHLDIHCIVVGQLDGFVKFSNHL
jgi:hypothetical protein